MEKIGLFQLQTHLLKSAKIMWSAEIAFQLEEKPIYFLRIQMVNPVLTGKLTTGSEEFYIKQGYRIRENIKGRISII